MNVAPATSGDKRNSVNNNQIYYIWVKKIDHKNSKLNLNLRKKNLR